MNIAKRNARAKVVRTVSPRRERPHKHVLPTPGEVSGKHANTRLQKPLKLTWTLAERRRWWLKDIFSQPLLPLPGDRVPEKDVAQAKRQAVEAMQEFGVLVEASRASGMGRLQLISCFRADTSTGDAVFATALRNARRECQERLEGAFIQRGMTKGGDLAGIFYQKHNWKKYREIQRVELTGKDGSPLNALDAAKADLLARLGKLAGPRGSGGSAGSREGLEGKREVIVASAAEPASSRPRLVESTPPRKVKKA